LIPGKPTLGEFLNRELLDKKRNKGKNSGFFALFALFALFPFLLPYHSLRTRILKMGSEIRTWNLER
jgi:hypothetical protein